MVKVILAEKTRFINVKLRHNIFNQAFSLSIFESAILSSAMVENAERTSRTLFVSLKSDHIFKGRKNAMLK